MGEESGFTPMDLVEVIAAMAGVAAGYEALVTELLKRDVALAEAHKAGRAWIHGTAGGKFEA